MTLTAGMYLTVCPLVFLAGFLDSVAGGGGMISLPAYYLAGLSPALAAGTNKLSAMMGTTVAAVNFAKAGRIDRQTAVPAVIGALFMSTMGALLLTALPQTTVRILVLCCVPVAAVFTLRKPHARQSREYSIRISWILSLMIGALVGFYDGLVGPGTGTFLILLFLQVFHMEAVTASGTAKVVNLASNIAAFGSLIVTGNVLFLLGLPAGLCAMLGAWIGSRLTVRKGGGFIRLMMLVVLGLLLLKMLADIVFPT